MTRRSRLFMKRRADTHNAKGCWRKSRVTQEYGLKQLKSLRHDERHHGAHQVFPLWCHVLSSACGMQEHYTWWQDSWY
jgi:hypothetical protein